MIKLKKIDYFYIKTKFKYHKKLKNKFLELINNSPSESYGNITRTDWNLNESKNYRNLFNLYFNEIIEKIGKKIKASEPEINSLWFQQYYTNDLHEWHDHPNTSYSNVYFLELPDEEYKTQFFNILTNKPFKDFDIQEGDIITFPGTLPHRSKKNLSKKRKTSIVFNTKYNRLNVRY